MEDLGWVLQGLRTEGSQAESHGAGRFLPEVTAAFPSVSPPIFPKLWAGTMSSEFSLALMLPTDILKHLTRAVNKGGFRKNHHGILW